MPSLKSIFNLTPHEINALGGLLGPLKRIFQIPKEKGVTMAIAKESVVELPGFKATIGIAVLIGFVGGLLFGIWDSVTVIFNTAPWAVYTLPEMLSLSLYSAAIFALIGCLVMMAIGVISAGIIRIGRYSVNKALLTGVFICVAVLLMVSAIITVPSVTGDIIDIIEVMVICTLSGLGLASLMIYALNKRMRKEELIALSISSLVCVIVLLLVGLWINMGVYHNKELYELVPVLADIGLLLVVRIFGLGLYRLVVWIFQRHPTRGIKQAGGILLIFMLAAFVAVSFTGPYGFDNKAVAITAGDSVNSEGMPNILWIVMDTVRADHLSSYGYQHNTTPNIDKIADEGILYENAISTAPWTLPSHASMFTGTFPSKHGTDWEHTFLHGDLKTIAEVLSGHGYETLQYSNNEWVSSRSGLQQGFDNHVLTIHGAIKPSALPDYLMIGRAKLYIENEMLLMDDGAQKTNEVVMNWIADAHQAEAPFFAFINYMEAHSPYHPPEEYAAPYLGEDVDFEEAMKTPYGFWGYMAGKVEISDRTFEIQRALYDGEISYLDFRIGQLLDYLRDLNILDNTLLIITSDHGELFGEHQLASHQLCIYDTLLHVPLIIRYPGLAEAGLRVEEQVQLTDLFPTILDIAGINWSGEEQLQGQSLVKDMKQPGSEFAIAEYALSYPSLTAIGWGGWGSDVNKYARRLKTIRTEEFKYIWASDGMDELYNIREDPEELNNLIEVEPEKAVELKALLKQWLNSFETHRPDEAEKLR